MGDVVLVETVGATRLVTVNRPEARNALTRAVIAGVTKALHDANARSAPKPTAAPSIIAIVGFSQRTTDFTRPWNSSMYCSRCSSSCGSSAKFWRRSAPAQKCPPAPVRTTQRTAASAWASWNARVTPARTARVRAFRASGRLMVTKRVAPTVSTRTTSLIAPHPSRSHTGPGMLPWRP